LHQNFLGEYSLGQKTSSSQPRGELRALKTPHSAVCESRACRRSFHTGGAHLRRVRNREREREREKVCRSGEIFRAHAGRLQFTWSLRAAARTHSRAHYIMCSCVRALRNEFAHSSGARQAIQADANMRHYLSRCCSTGDRPTEGVKCSQQLSRHSPCSSLALCTAVEKK
jgi:hypothetical protein